MPPLPGELIFTPEKGGHQEGGLQAGVGWGE